MSIKQFRTNRTNTISLLTAEGDPILKRSIYQATRTICTLTAERAKFMTFFLGKASKLAPANRLVKFLFFVISAGILGSPKAQVSPKQNHKISGEKTIQTLLL